MSTREQRSRSPRAAESRFPATGRVASVKVSSTETAVAASCLSLSGEMLLRLELPSDATVRSLAEHIEQQLLWKKCVVLVPGSTDSVPAHKHLSEYTEVFAKEINSMTVTICLFGAKPVVLSGVSPRDTIKDLCQRLRSCGYAAAVPGDRLMWGPYKLNAAESLEEIGVKDDDVLSQATAWASGDGRCSAFPERGE
eukprot:gnl/TRDRNA2_/TRDRNA2_27920_c0_seq1.p1 gnl/TRDRNA2_/TRDRNA2_27920_c0~~gnl/TRDRNA2_/TRDRNA2_27920_c0_seq1.p1  ORF type:complete len:216 (+),score=22.53 gnl/TRDRNA2_/TRDRNA2_27920_c0_seq1:61-648(+)